MYSIETPPIKSGNTYFFNTDSGMRYEVKFGRKKENILCATLVFGVVNCEETDEYGLTNRGEVWQVMNTIVEIGRVFMSEHPAICYYEIYALEKEGESEDQTSSRMNLYFRFIPRLFNESWKLFVFNNKAIVLKKEVEHLYASVIADELSPKETISKEEKEVSSFSLNRLLSFIDRRRMN
jgi:hypothetical protein